MSTNSARREFAKAVIDLAIRNALAAIGGKSRSAFEHAIKTVQSRSDLLRPRRFIGRIDSEALERLVQGLLALVVQRKHWLRPIEAWEPCGSAPFSLFSSLAHHLIAQYPVPPVFLSAWFLGISGRAQIQQRWFRHVGLGGSLRTAGFPISLTKRMAHELALAPPHYPIEPALRWAQVRGFGGSDRLAFDVVSTRLGHDFSHDGFWKSVVQLFVNTPAIETAQVRLIVDYLHDQKYECQRVVIGDENEVWLDPVQPDLSIKGRTVASLFRRAKEWQAAGRPNGTEKQVIRWARSAIGEYRRDVGEGIAWTIRELLDSDALVTEGKRMKHCVATYTEPCFRRSSTIWSLASEGPRGRRRVVTVEVNPETKEVVQASMKHNNAPREPYMAILKEWAQMEGLLINCCEQPEA